MARLKPRSGSSILGLSMDQIWQLKYGHIGMPCGIEFPFPSMEAARLAWLRHRDSLLATKFSDRFPFWGETEFDPEYETQRQETRRRLEERANA